MPDGALASETVLERLTRLHPKLIDLSLDRMWRLLAALGNPEDRLPPVLHVAGTNGKGSTTAFLRAMVEAAGLHAHVYTSPHLVRFHERIRLAGRLVQEEQLYATLLEVERANAEAPITFFEITTACALLLMARIPADVTILEVGLGGRLDATNVVARPAATLVTSISFDHMDWLGDTLTLIAREKSGIFRAGVPAITGRQPAEAMEAIEAAASGAGARLLARDRDFAIARIGNRLRWDGPGGAIELPVPALAGPHQLDNAAIAIAALRAIDAPRLPDAAIAAGVARAEWPARLQRLSRGPLVGLLPAGWEIWLDGGHNPAAGQALAAHAAEAWRDRPLYAVVGMKAGKGVEGFLAPLLGVADGIWAVAEPRQHLAMPVGEIIAASGGVARSGPTLAEAVAAAAREHGPARVLVCGSLYLAGLVLAENG
jgi:dihydrofolate synthase/folylpolyglutamate synthase